MHGEDLPVIALDGSGSECVATTELLQRCLEVVRRTTIRAPSTQEKTAGFLRPTNTPACPLAATADCLRTSGDLKKSRRGMTPDIFAEALNSDMHADDLKGLLGWKGKEDQVTHPLTVSTIQDFIRSRMGIVDGVKQYANVWVKSVYPVARIKPGRMTSGLKVLARIMEHTTGEDYVPPETFHLQKLLIRVQGQGSCFCANLGGHHQSNSIYFEMGPGNGAFVAMTPSGRGARHARTSVPATAVART